MTAGVVSELPADLSKLHEALLAVDRAAADVVAGLSEDALNWQPKGGRGWSVAQCLDHLTVSNRVYVEPMRAAVLAARGQDRLRKGSLALPFFGRLFVSYLEPPPRMKGPAPGKIVPAARKRKDEVLPEFLASQAAVRDLLTSCADLDLNGVRFENPFLPVVRFTLGTGFCVIAAHGRRHLWQANRVRASDGFPGPR